MIDIDNEMISSLQLERPERYRDIPYIMAKHGIISKTFAYTFAAMIGFRNILVRDYMAVDLNLLYRFLQTKLEDSHRFVKHVVGWLNV